LVQIFMVDSLLRRWRAQSTQQRNMTTPMATMNVVVEVRMMTSNRLLLMCPCFALVAMAGPALLKSNEVGRQRNNCKGSLVARRVQEFKNQDNIHSKAVSQTLHQPEFYATNVKKKWSLSGVTVTETYEWSSSAHSSCRPAI
jgi:hypothetical protein